MAKIFVNILGEEPEERVKEMLEKREFWLIQFSWCIEYLSVGRVRWDQECCRCWLESSSVGLSRVLLGCVGLSWAQAWQRCCRVDDMAGILHEFPDASSSLPIEPKGQWPFSASALLPALAVAEAVLRQWAQHWVVECTASEAHSEPRWSGRLRKLALVVLSGRESSVALIERLIQRISRFCWALLEVVHQRDDSALEINPTYTTILALALS